MSNDFNKIDKKDERALLVENLAEDLMQNAEMEVACVIRQSKYQSFNHDMTRADISDLCSTDEFNELFYKMAELLISKCD